MKCMCCKEIGHNISDCPRDPNIRTKVGKMAQDDFDRIQKIRDNRVCFIDTMITTTHLLKRCIKVQKPNPKDGVEDTFGQSPEEIEQMLF